MDIPEKIDIIISGGAQLLEVMNREEPISDRNLIVYAFLRKTVRLTLAFKVLVETG